MSKELQVLHSIPGLMEALSHFFGATMFSGSSRYQLVTDSSNQSNTRCVSFILVFPADKPPKKPVHINATGVEVRQNLREDRVEFTILGPKVVVYDVTAETKGRTVIDVVPTKTHVKVTIRLPKGSQCEIPGGKMAAVVFANDVRAMGLQMGLLPRDPAVIRDKMQMVHVKHVERLARNRGFITPQEGLVHALRSGWQPPEGSCPYDVFGEPTIEAYNAALAEFDAAVAAKQAPPAAEPPAANGDDVADAGIGGGTESPAPADQSGKPEPVGAGACGESGA